MPPRKGDGLPGRRIWGRSHQNGRGSEQTRSVQSRMMGSQLPGMKLRVKCCELFLAAWKKKVLLSPGKKGAPLELDGPDPPAPSKAPTISRIKLGKLACVTPI